VSSARGIQIIQQGRREESAEKNFRARSGLGGSGSHARRKAFSEILLEANTLKARGEKEMGSALIAPNCWPEWGLSKLEMVHQTGRKIREGPKSDYKRTCERTRWEKNP